MHRFCLSVILSLLFCLFYDLQELHPPLVEECPICLESIPVTSSKSVRLLVCWGNMFCYKCYHESFARNTVIQVCPLCRSDLIIDSNETISLTIKQALNGKAWAQASMGYLYLYGLKCQDGDAARKNGIERDMDQAVKWLELAAEQRYPCAIRMLAEMYLGLYDHLDGENGDVRCRVDKAKARALMKQAADMGNLSAQRHMGMACRLCQGDEEESAHYYTLAFSHKDVEDGKSECILNNAPTEEIIHAAHYLGEFYYFGTGGFSRNL